jgi:hypothetical protein
VVLGDEFELLGSLRSADLERLGRQLVHLNLERLSCLDVLEMDA